MENKKSTNPTPSEPSKMVYRYACPACTNVAFENVTNDEGKSVVCKSCGKQLVTEKKNYILL